MRVLIADDHSLVRDGIKGILEAAGYDVVGQANDGHEAITETRRTEPDLVLMDLSMPRMNGIEALKRIKAENPNVKIVILTVSDDDDDLLTAMKIGAHGYILKSLNSEGFLQALKELNQGSYALSPQSAYRLIDGLLDTSKQKKQENELSDRETEVLQLMAAGFSNNDIANRLSVSVNTVKYYSKKIYQKMNVKNRAEAVSNAMRLNLVDHKN